MLHIHVVSAQVFVNFQISKPMVTSEYSDLGLIATADAGVGLSGGGIGVAGGLLDGLIETGEKIDVQLPFAATHLRLASLPIIGNFNFDFEAFENGTSVGTIPYNFILDGIIDFTEVFGGPIDAFCMTGINGPVAGENISYLAFSPPVLINQGMEEGAPGQMGASGWEFTNSAITFEGNANTGSNSVQLIVPTGKDFSSSTLFQDFSGVTEGMFVQASAFALHSISDPITGENVGRVTLDFLDQGGIPIDVNPGTGETGVLSQAIDENTPLDQFVLLNTGYFEAPAGTHSARITLSHTQSPLPNNQGRGSVFFDDACLNITSEPILKTFPALGKDFQMTDKQKLNGGPPLLYEIIHDGVSQIRIDTLGSDNDTAIILYDDYGQRIDATTGSAPDGTPGVQQAQLFYPSLPAGRYVIMVGRKLGKFEQPIFLRR